MKKSLLVLLLFIVVKNTSAQIQTAGSYLNVSRPSGGPTQRNDILEIRAVIAVPSGTTITLARFTDNVPAGTIYVTNSLKTVTNEGLVVTGIANTGNYTDVAGDDKGQNVSGAITINIGDGSTSSVGGTINGTTTRPRHYNAACIIMVTYRVSVNVSTGGSITLNGTFNYTTTSAQTINLPANALRVAALGGCFAPSAINAITVETGGTFGVGLTQNRSASANVTGFNYQNLASGTPSDGQYSIAKNTSPTQYIGASPASSDRVFGAWDVVGDHTGTTNGAGNAASGSASSGGYMAVVNASYAPGAVFNVPISGLNQNSAYTLSFWIRNICGTCGNNPSGNSGSGTPGVKPNLAFEMDGVDLYSTGELTYTGTWVQKSFTFYSGALNSFSMTIRNNAPGGGGNDWAIDDIIVSECFIVLPVKMELFTANKKGNDIELQWETSDQKNLSYFTIEKSTDGVNFNGIGNVPGKINNNAKNDYQFTDNNKSTGKIYYRLMIVDEDNKATYSKTLVASGKNIANELMVVPNPVRSEGVLNIESTVKGEANINIYNADGKLMLRQNNTVIEGSNQVRVEKANTLANGIYLVQVNVGMYKMMTRMIVNK
ncbi:MAG: T9SS type A sorting domain-containing protein [Chitinophagaceae bacterium]